MRKSVPKIKTYSPQFIHWSFLFILAASLRFLFIFKGNIAFRSDDAILCDYLHKWGTPLFSDEASSWRIVDGIRLYLGVALDRLFHSWLYSAEAGAVLLNLLGGSLWVWFVYRKVSPLAAFAMAVALTVFPLSMIYYSTVYERRLVTVVLGAVLALGAGVWSRSYPRAFLFGFLAAWGSWEEELFIFFIPAVLWMENWKSLLKKSEKAFKKGGLALAGISAGSLMGFLHLLKQPEFPANHLHYGVSNLDQAAQHGKLLAQALPLYWTGHMPFGYLQNSVLGLSLDPEAARGNFLWLSLWTWLTFAFALFGFWAAGRAKGQVREAVVILALPAFLLFVFFIFSAQIWDAMSFRYLSYWTVFEAAGFGMGIHFLFRYKKALALAAGIIWLAGWGTLLGIRALSLPSTQPGEVIAQGLDHLGIRAGWANYWVSEVVRYQTRDRILLTAYNQQPFSWKASQAAGQAKEIGLVAVQGLDNDEMIGNCISQLKKIGYSPVGRWDSPQGWFVIKLAQKKRSGG